MAGVLSQREIDALLSALPQEEKRAGLPATKTGKPVKVYDFRHPDKFSKDQLRTLEMVHENCARRIGSSMSSHLRTVVGVTLTGIEPQMYDEYIQQVPNPAVLYIMSLDPLPGRAILEIHPNIAFIIVDRLLGGFGKGLTRARELTDVELTLLEGVVWEILSAVKDSWGNITVVTPKMGDVAFTPQFLQVALPTDICLTPSFEVKIMESTGLIRLCIPYVVLEPVMSQLTAQAFFASSRKELEPAQQRDLRRQLDSVTVQLVAQLGTAELTVDDLTKLRKGDVIPLNQSANRDLNILMVGDTKFYGRPGRVGRRMAIQISGVVEEDEDDEGGLR